MPYGTYISIHAPREGCDEAVRAEPPSLPLFQSTHPARGATQSGVSLLQKFIISIHAPREGCDRGGMSAPMRGGDFNPRTPRGVRPIAWFCFFAEINFNPRTPRGVRRPGAGRLHHQMPISIHAPREGCDGIGVPAGHDPLLHFNPRTPRGVRLGPQMILTRPPVFQSTHPARGATWHEAASAA